MITKDRTILRTVSRPTFIGECQEIKIFEELSTELAASPREGYALAAIQIGKPIKAIFIGDKENAIRAINAKITNQRGPFVHPDEGCLSIDTNKNTNRFKEVEVEYLDYDTGNLKKAWYGDTIALVWQHECDHIEGITILEREYKKPQSRNENCACNSGKKFKHCHGK